MTFRLGLGQVALFVLLWVASDIAVDLVSIWNQLRYHFRPCENARLVLSIHGTRSALIFNLY